MTREVALILNMNKPYDRKIIRGVSSWIRERRDWNLYLEDDSLAKIPDLQSWSGNGVIADFDDPRVSAAMRELELPIVGLGGGFRGASEGIPTVYYDTDNDGIAHLAAEHFLERGFTNFAYCGYARTRFNRWSAERGIYFSRLLADRGFDCATYKGREVSPQKWDALQDKLRRWLQTLELPVALFAANDARARHILMACHELGLRSPEDVAILGVDDDSTTCELASPPLSSIIQGAQRLGYEAAKVLDALMNGEPPESDHFVIPPVGVVTRQSTDVTAVDDPAVASALAYIRDQACNHVQVLDVARAAGCSRSSLEKKFRAMLNRSVHAEIQRRQLRRVEELLLHTDVPLKEVAQRCGFSSVQYMSSVVRKAVDVTPGQYRRQRGS
jgi:LacI family transcriptional regulator